MAISQVAADGVATITLDRPEKLNALDVAHLRELRRLLSEASAQPDIHAVVLTGAGERAFCAGADLAAAPAAQTGVAEAFGYDLDRAAEHGLYIRLMDLSGLRLRKPVIAAVNGFCLGGGLELALQCDLIVASEQASFGLPEVVVASLPGAGGVPNLLRAIPKAVAMRMLLTGERIIRSARLRDRPGLRPVRSRRTGRGCGSARPPHRRQRAARRPAREDARRSDAGPGPCPVDADDRARVGTAARHRGSGGGAPRLRGKAHAQLCWPLSRGSLQSRPCTT